MDLQRGPFGDIKKIETFFEKNLGKKTKNENFLIEGDPLETFKKIETFFEKFSGKRKMRILKQSHSDEKLERGDPLGFLKLQFAAKYQKT